MESISVICQPDGFFEVPSLDSSDNCLLGTICEEPPIVSDEGTLTVTPKVMEVETVEKCEVWMGLPWTSSVHLFSRFMFLGLHMAGSNSKFKRNSYFKY